jgi:hypothetical protein
VSQERGEVRGGLAPQGQGNGRRWYCHDPVKFVDDSIVNRSASMHCLEKDTLQ